MVLGGPSLWWIVPDTLGLCQDEDAKRWKSRRIMGQEAKYNKVRLWSHDPLQGHPTNDLGSSSH